MVIDENAKAARKSNRPAFAQAGFGAAAFACFAQLRHCRLAEP
jgi:hypothetical protein